MTSPKCRYGDVESVELVNCTVNTESGVVSCPEPRKRANVSNRIGLRALARVGPRGFIGISRDDAK